MREKEHKGKERRKKRRKRRKQKRKKSTNSHVSLLVGAVATLGDDAAALVDEHAADGDLLSLEGGGGLGMEGGRVDVFFWK